MSLLDELLVDLPTEPPRAIVTYADRVKARILTPHKASENAEQYDAIASFALKFCAKYKIPVELKAGQRNGFDFMEHVINVILANRSAILKGSVDSEIDDLLIQYDSRLSDSFGLARLNADEKKKIHEHIKRIRELIESSDLSDRKKNALFDRLNKLSNEVDSHGTGTDRFFAFVGDLGFTMGEFGKNAKPLFDEVRGLIQAVSRARARQEGISLPPGDEPVKLPPPANEG